MKAILVIDKMPENCMECPLRFKDGYTDDWFRFRCHISTDQIPKEGRLLNCELKPIPQKKEIIGTKYIKDSNQYALAWNACIDEILGEDE